MVLQLDTGRQSAGSQGSVDAMNRKQDQRERTHDEILAAAGRLFRSDGFEPTGIGQIMDTIGLTVGGFYNHFESKDALFREVVDTTVSKTVEVDAPAEPEPEHYARDVAARYLTTEHRDNPAGGCLLPCLSADVARADDEVRTAYARFVTRVVEKMARSMPDGDSRSAEERAWAVTALCVGGLLLSRAVPDKELSERILAACRDAAGEI
jgi:TetR/AcrR family transcriptional repressor of nem operon